MALIHSPFFTCLTYRIKKRKKATTFKLIKLLKHTQKHALTTEAPSGKVQTYLTMKS